MYSEVSWVLLSYRTQVQPQIILDPDYFPDYLSVSSYRSCCETSKDVMKDFGMNLLKSFEIQQKRMKRKQSLRDWFFAF